MVLAMHRICGKLWSQEDICGIRALIEASPDARRANLAHQVCEAFDWRMPDGRLKLMSCRVAMLKMHRDNLISLPPPRCVQRRPSTNFQSQASDPKPLAEVALAALEGLKLELVAKGAPLRLWNEFISRYHYLGYKAMPGAQLRYFITAGEQVLGAMGFGAAAWKVAPRDSFIGWSSELRERQLHLVVNQTRFLILPWVRCQNLATKTLAMVAKRLPDDWEARYGYRPALMETFVDASRPGTCYKAGNWTLVGMTQGRGRHDRFHANAASVKSIWLMPLRRDFRNLLTLKANG